MLDYLFIKPGNQKILYGETAFKLSAIEPPFWPLLLASYLSYIKRPVKIIDLEVSPIDELIYLVSITKPTNVVICVSGHNPSASMMNMTGIDNLTKIIKRESLKSTIHLHGLYPSTVPRKILNRHKMIDNIILQEGLDYLGFLTGFRIDPLVNLQVSKRITINDIPPIDWGLIDITKYRAHNWHCFGRMETRNNYGILYTSFGCPYHCDFCCIHNLHKTVQLRDINFVFEDLRNLYNLGIRNIKIMDELFTTNKKRVIELCYKIIENKMTDINAWAYARTDSIDSTLVKIMREAGIRWLGIGYESGSQEILNSSNKSQKLEKAYRITELCKNNDMYICGNFMFGLIDDNFETMENTIRLAIELQPEWANFNVVHAFPGTRLYELVKREPWFNEPDSYEAYSQHGYYCQPMGTKYLTPEEVLKFKDEAFRRFYKHLPYLEMIERKFDIETRKHIENDLNYYPTRKILEK